MEEHRATGEVADERRTGLPPDVSARILGDDPYGRLLIDGDGVVLGANRAAAAIAGYEVEDVIGHNMAEFIAPEHLEQAARVLDEVASRHPVESEGIPLVFGLLHADGRTVYAEIGSQNYLGDPTINAVAVRVRPYDSQRSLERFLGSLVTDTPMGEVLGYLVDSIDHLVQTAGSAVCFGWNGHYFTEVISRELPRALAGGTPMHPGMRTSPWQLVKRTGEPVWTDITRLDPELAEAASALGYRTCWALPIRAHPGDADVEAVIVIWRRVDGPPRVGHEAGLDRICRAAALAFERRQTHLRLVEAATVDPLTGIPNRAQFFSALEDEVLLAPPERIAVLYLDLDEFKPVNDEHGHRFGDHVLAAVATELAGQIRPGDMVARLGGDEFAVLCRDVAHLEQVTAIADRLIAAVRQPFVIEGTRVQLGLSIGIALAGPTTTSHDAVLDAADRALYQAKRSGKGGWTLASRP